MFVDSLHNEIILNTTYGSKACNATYRGLVAYDGNNFHDLDFGLDKHKGNPAAGGKIAWGCITYGNKTLFGGTFLSVGSNTLFAKSLALWNGAAWDTFPKFVFPNDLSGKGGGIAGYLKYNGKLWIYGAIDTIGGIITNNVATFDGNSFASIPAIPSNLDYYVGKMVVYKNKLIAIGDFYLLPNWTFARVAMFDGTSWSSVGTGVRGSIAFAEEMAIYQDTLYIAGSWQQSSGNVGNHIMKWDGTQLTDAGFGNFNDWGGITSLVVFKNRLYAFGGFTKAANQKAFGVAYYENGKWTVPQDSIGVSAPKYAVVYNDAIYMGGSFKNINGDTTIHNFAKLICPDFDASTGCISGILEQKLNTFQLSAFPNPATSKLKFKTELQGKGDLKVLSATGQVIHWQNEFDPTQELDIKALAAGFYLIQLRIDNKIGILKFIKE